MTSIDRELHVTDAPLTHTPLKRIRLIARTMPIFVGVAMAGMPGTATAKTYAGKPVHQQYGEVQVKITVSKGRIAKVMTSAPEEYARSKEINSHAVPIYDREALSTQKVSGVHKVSGASLTWTAFDASLAEAMKEAHLHGA